MKKIVMSMGLLLCMQGMIHGESRVLPQAPRMLETEAQQSPNAKAKAVVMQDVADDPGLYVIFLIVRGATGISDDIWELTFGGQGEEEGVSDKERIQAIRALSPEELNEMKIKYYEWRPVARERATALLKTRGYVASPPLYPVDQWLEYPVALIIRDVKGVSDDILDDAAEMIWEPEYPVGDYPGKIAPRDVLNAIRNLTTEELAEMKKEFDAEEAEQYEEEEWAEELEPAK